MERDEASYAIEEFYNQRSMVIFVVLIGAIAIALSSFFGVLKPVDEPGAIWFQRSGSLVVFLAVLSEYKIQQSKTVLSNLRPIDLQGDRNQLYDYHHLGIASLILALVGTVIWGYGDIIYLFVT